MELIEISAGVGRTGTYIAVDWLMQQVRASKEIDVFDTVYRMRQCRVSMVQNPVTANNQSISRSLA